MIIIEHALNYVRVYSWRGYEFKPTGKHREYAIGEVKPNYPMPAIRLDTDINEERVQIYNDTQGRLEYYYSFERI